MRDTQRQTGNTEPTLIGAGAWCHTLLLFVLGASWGLQFTLLKMAANARPGELGILTLCMVLLAGADLVTLAIRKEWFRPTVRHVRFFVISSLFGYVVPLGGVILVTEYIAAGMIVFYSEALIPVFTVAIALALRTERLTLRRLGAVACALLGVTLALWPEFAVSTGVWRGSLVIVFIFPLAYAIDGVYVAACWPEDLRPFQVVTGEAVMGASMLLPLWLVFEDVAGPPNSMGIGEWAILAFVPVSYLEVYLYFHLLSTVGAVFVSFGSFVSLSAGFFWGSILLGEQQRPSVWIAVALVSVALYLISVKARAAEAVPATSRLAGRSDRVASTRRSG